MKDREIVNLYLKRDQGALSETSAKYGNYLKSIAQNILGSSEDAEECINDAYLNAWNSIPPHKPRNLATFLGKITRNLAFDRYRQRQSAKRGSGQIDEVLEELSECISGRNNVEDEIDGQELANCIDAFLGTLSKEACDIFLCRYWYACSITKIAEKFAMTETNVSVTLSRIRGKLKTYLTERGYVL